MGKMRTELVDSDLYFILTIFLMGVIIGIFVSYIDPIRNILDLIYVLLVVGTATLVSLIIYVWEKNNGK
jgi:hypothetical protein